MKLSQILLARGQLNYWQRYVERVMQREYLSRLWHPLAGWKEQSKKNWHYGEHRPWTADFLKENKERRAMPRMLLEPIKNWKIFKGDRVEILVGKDKGKQGLVNSIIKERNWVYVEGLNLNYTMQSQIRGMPPICVASEKPLMISTQVKLVDPGDELPTDVEWRFTEEGEKVRVSTRTGRIVPLPNGYNDYDDFVNPKQYLVNKEKDSIEREVLEVTFKPKLCTFEEDILDSMGIKENRKPAPTYWY